MEHSCHNNKCNLYHLWSKYASEHWLTQTNAENDGCVVFQKDLPVTGISHESIFTITPANDRWDSWTTDWVGGTEVNESRACYQVWWKPELLQTRSRATTKHHEGEFSSRELKPASMERGAAGTWLICRERQAQHNTEWCIPGKEPLPIWLLSPFHSIFCSSHSPTPQLTSKWHHGSCSFGSAHCHKSCAFGESCDRGWHFICLFPINTFSSHLHLKPPQNITNSWEDDQSCKTMGIWDELLEGSDALRSGCGQV